MRSDATCPPNPRVMSHCRLRILPILTKSWVVPYALAGSFKVSRAWPHAARAERSYPQDSRAPGALVSLFGLHE